MIIANESDSSLLLRRHLDTLELNKWRSPKGSGWAKIQIRMEYKVW